MRIALASLLVSSIAAAGGRLDPAGAPTTEHLSNHVLVWLDAALYIEPTDTSHVLHAGAVDGPRKDALGAAMPMKVIGRRDSFIEVAPLDDHDCAVAAIVEPPTTSFHLFVRGDDLAPVVAKPFVKRFGDGTSIDLGPGTPVIPIDIGFLARVGAAEVPVELGARDSTYVGHSYAPAVPTKPAIVATIAPGSRLQVGDHDLGSPIDPTEVTAMRPRGDDTLVTFQGRCGKVSALVSTSRVDAKGPATGRASGISIRSDLGDILPTGTPVTTEAGRSLGKLTRDVSVATDKRDDQRACVDAALTVSLSHDAHDGWAVAPAAERTIRLCAPAKLVVHRR